MMNDKNYTLKELTNIGAAAAVRHTVGEIGREAFTKAILDAIGYEFPKDEEREAFSKWWKTSNLYTFCNADDAFKAWKAGREELRQAINKHSYSMPPSYGGVAYLTSQKVALTTDTAGSGDACVKEKIKTTEPAWILWHGGKCPLPENTKCEISSYDGKKAISEAGRWDWDHTGDGYDIVAYRVIE